MQKSPGAWALAPGLFRGKLIWFHASPYLPGYKTLGCHCKFCQRPKVSYRGVLAPLLVAELKPVRFKPGDRIEFLLHDNLWGDPPGIRYRDQRKPALYRCKMDRNGKVIKVLPQDFSVTFVE